MGQGWQKRNSFYNNQQLVFFIFFFLLMVFNKHHNHKYTQTPKPFHIHTPLLTQKPKRNGQTNGQNVKTTCQQKIIIKNFHLPNQSVPHMDFWNTLSHSTRMIHFVTGTPPPTNKRKQKPIKFYIYILICTTLYHKHTRKNSMFLSAHKQRSIGGHHHCQTKCHQNHTRINLHSHKIQTSYTRMCVCIYVNIYPQ